MVKQLNNDIDLQKVEQAQLPVLLEPKPVKEAPQLKSDSDASTTASEEEKTLYIIPKVDEEKHQIMRLLIIVALVSVLFCICQIIGGYLANSLAIMQDAAHIFSDVSGFIISIIAIKLSKIEANKKMSFGYHRAEILGALTSVIVIWGLVIWLVVEAVYRIIDPEEIDDTIMLVTAILGLIFNIIQFKLLHNPKFARKSVGGHSCSHDHDHDHSHNDNDGHKHDHSDHENHSHANHNHGNQNDNKTKTKVVPDEENQKNQDTELKTKQEIEQDRKRKLENLNLRTAMIHVIGDLLQSVGLIIAALIVYIGGEEFRIVDPISTFIFSIIVLCTTKGVLKESISILMEGSPQSVDVEKLEKDLREIEGVCELHDLHVWSLSPSKLFLSVHMSSSNPSKTLVEAGKICIQHQIYHRTIQIENINEKHIYNNDLCKQHATCS